MMTGGRLAAVLVLATALLGGCGGRRARQAVSAVSPPVTAQVTSGLYEGFSPITMAPYGPLDAAATKRLPRWLDVMVDGDTLHVVERPEGRIYWTLRYGRFGLVSKRVGVDGEVWLESRFTRDEAGRLLDKEVTGPGAKGRLEYSYVVDAHGRVTERRRRDGEERWLVAYDQDGGTTVAATTWKGKNVRSDVFDPEGRLLRTELGEPARGKSRRLLIVYQRNSAGRLQNVIRRRGDGPTRFAAFDRPDHDVRAEDLIPIAPVVERHEVLLALGAPTSRSDDGRGVRRTSTDRFGDSCWLNQPSSIVYDAADRAHATETTCICGFCVDASLAATAPSAEVVGRDWHWTAGPWVRLDGAVDVTADHPVITPTGRRAAGELRAGDLVLGEDGGARPLLLVELLPDTGDRLGLNLRTTSGAFQAGGFTFASEQPAACPGP